MPSTSLNSCGVCRLHAQQELAGDLLIARLGPWLLRHHAQPVPLVGWLMLDSLRHGGGPWDFDPQESAGFGDMLRRSCGLVRQLTGCDRVYTIAFGEGAPHFHMHLIPRHGASPESESWRVADLYREAAAGERPSADPDAVAQLVARARPICAEWSLDAR